MLLIIELINLLWLIDWLYWLRVIFINTISFNQLINQYHSLLIIIYFFNSYEYNLLSYLSIYLNESINQLILYDWWIRLNLETVTIIYIKLQWITIIILIYNTNTHFNHHSRRDTNLGCDSCTIFWYKRTLLYSMIMIKE